MRVGVYVGSFDPVHNGHEKLVRFLLDKKYLDKIIIVPTLDYWNKHDLTNIKDRENMLKYVFNDETQEIDITLSKFQYTYEIVNYLRSAYDDEFYLIIGADNMVDFDKWKNTQDILKNYVMVLNRNDIDVSKYVDSFREKDKFIIIDNYPYLDVSSTYIRDNVKNDNFDVLDKVVNKKVLKYIDANNLYR